MNETKATQILKWAIVGIVVIVGIIALAMSWYSMMDLATTTFGAPEWLAWLISIAFDGGAIALLLVTVSNALKGESAFAAELFGYLFIATSFYINITHAGLEGMGLPGQVMFGAAPIILAITFKFLVHMLTRDYRRREGLLKERIPNAGLLVWILKTKEAWSLLMDSLQNRLNKARGQLKYVAAPQIESVTKERDTLHVTATTGDPVTDLVAPVTKELVTKTVTPKPVTASATKDVTATEVVTPVTKQPMGFVAPDVTRPEWLVADPKMSNATFAALCVTNGVTDTATATKLRELQTGQEVKAESIRMAIYRAKPKGE